LAASSYPRLDFNLPDAPKDILSILIAIRDQLQHHDDGYGKHLTFPRFDLGALIVQSMPTPENLASFGPQDVRHKLDAGLQSLESLTNIGSELGLVVPFIIPLLAGIRLARQSRPVQKALRYLEDQAGWKWYGKVRGARLGLGASAGLEDVLRRLAAMSMPGKPERVLLIEEILPAAFMADIFEALVQANPPLAWGKTTNVVLFMDGFEQLQQVSNAISTRLLQVLTIEQRKEGQTDPLLLVIGTRSRFPGFVDGREHPSFEGKTSVLDERSVQQYVRSIYERWRQQLPGNKSVLRLKDLYLSLVLRDFGLDDVSSYLVKFGEQERTQLLADGALVQSIARVTHGHPLSLALAAAALVEANERGRVLSPDQFDVEYVSEKVLHDHKRGYEEERIRDYLLELFLRQLEKPERDELIFCAVPRWLDVAVLRAMLQLPTDVEARRRWERYADFTFTTVVEHDRLILHPLIRTLLLRHIPPDDRLESDYCQIHQRLQKYFHQRATEQKRQGQAELEEAYHALALGDANPAIRLGIAVQQNTLALWDPLLTMVAEAPTGLIPSDAKQRAYDAALKAERQHQLQDAVIAIILSEWQLVAFQDEPQKVADWQNILGNAYTNLPGGDRQANLERAITCFEAALQVCTREAFPFEWAMTQNNMGIAYARLPGGDWQANLERAITCYEAALQVRTRDAFPVDWAMTQMNLGTAYAQLLNGDRRSTLQRAITCFEAALQVFELRHVDHSLQTAKGFLKKAKQELEGLE
jgi:tetratricopeptide (TPR) repeat protein